MLLSWEVSILPRNASWFLSWRVTPRLSQKVQQAEGSQPCGISLIQGDEVPVARKVEQNAFETTPARKGSDALLFRDDKSNRVWCWRTSK